MKRGNKKYATVDLGVKRMEDWKTLPVVVEEKRKRAC